MQYKMMETEWESLQGSWAERAWHGGVQADPKLREETLDGYSYRIVLAPEESGWGVGGGFVLAFLVESVLLGIGWLIVGGRRRVVKESWR